MIRLLTFPIRLVRSVIRFVGVKNSFFLLLGVGIGLLVAPTSGRQLRARLAAELESRRLGGPATDVTPIAPTTAAAQVAV